MERYTTFMNQKNQYCEMTIVPEAIYRFSVILLKLPMAFSTELEEKIYNLYGNTKDPKQPKES